MITSETQLDEALTAPHPEDIECVAKLPGDILVLGAAGKMGPSLVRRVERAVAAAGVSKRVIAVSRSGAGGIAADLLDERSVAALPDAENVLYLAGRKFGSTDNAPLTWATNTWTPALAARKFRGSRIVAFSTGNVYPLLPPASGGATEATPAAPVGEYAQSALARERIFEYFSAANNTPVTLLRLNYAIDLRYGVLLEIGQKVFTRSPVDLTMGFVNVIWQGDANSVCLRALALCTAPPRILNLTGPEILSVRDLARRFGEHFGLEPVFQGEEGATALLSNAAECRRLLGPPRVGIDEMVAMTASWIRGGGRTLGKPTHYETRDGAF